MWIDDIYWLPKVLNGHKIEAEFHFNEDGSSFDKYNINLQCVIYEIDVK